jgi:hypothetical protein
MLSHAIAWQHDRVVGLGLGSEGAWPLAIGDTVCWSKLAATGSRPPDLYGHSFTYDAAPRLDDDPE